MTPTHLEKTLKRATLLVSVTAFIVFGSLASYYFLEGMAIQEDVERGSKIHMDAYFECRKSLSANLTSAISNVGPCSFDVSENEYFKSAQQRKNANAQVRVNFNELMLYIPVTVWFLFFSIRWVLTGQKPWQRTNLPVE